ncbi:MAG: ATP-binding cassette domain-containing protein [Deltaproteobacteria bacterium]|nr:ATP-binding cassette domain-containing protein [Deltaproteobacteria bacterium]
MIGGAIRVIDLSKRYRIGAKEGYKTFRETLIESAKAPFTRIGRAGRSVLSRMHFGEASTRSSVVGQPSSSEETIWALKDVSFDVKQGEVVGIIGRNGAGKSTLLKVLSKITEPTTGRVELKGRVGSLLEVGTGFHPELTGHENVYLYGAILGMDRWEVTRKFDEIIAFAELEKFVDTPVKRYSSGMYMRLAFAVAAHLEPEILLVDEVLAVGDAAFQKKCLGKMGDVSREGRTVLFVSHNLAAIQALCDSAILLEKGRIYRSGRVDEVIQAYMEEVMNGTMGSKGTPFPVNNEELGISVRSCLADLEEREGQEYDLRVKIEIDSERTVRNIGVGLSVTSIRGTPVCILAPSVTNYVIEEVQGRCLCLFECEDITRFLAGGDYVLGIWLSKPRVEYLLRIDEAAVITIPPIDVFSTGTYFEERHYGIIPLPITFSVEAGNSATTEDGERV